MRGILGVLALTGMLAGSAGADTMEFPLSTPTVISDVDGSARVLFRQPDLSALQDHLIFGARLEFDLPAQESTTELYVQVNPIARDWLDGQVSWRAPWTNPGGDREDAYFHTARVRDSGGKLVLDVGAMVRASLEGEIVSHGFVLSVPYRAGTGFRVTELSRLGSLGAGKLVVEHRKFRTPRAVREARG